MADDPHFTHPVPDDNGKSNLSLLLTPEEAQRLATAGQDPSEHTLLTLEAYRVGAGKIYPDGSMDIHAVVRLPRGVFKEKSKLIVAGQNINPLDDVLGVSPAVILAVRIDRLTEETRIELEQVVTAMIQASVVETEGDKPSGAPGLGIDLTLTGINTPTDPTPH